MVSSGLLKFWKNLKETYNVPAVGACRFTIIRTGIFLTPSQKKQEKPSSKHPSIQVLLDIHRDAGIKRNIRWKSTVAKPQKS